MNALFGVQQTWSITVLSSNFLNNSVPLHTILGMTALASCSNPLYYPNKPKWALNLTSVQYIFASYFFEVEAAILNAQEKNSSL